jgi:glutaredoxin 3
MAAKVEIYISPFCGYCSRAKRLLSQKGVDYIDYDVIEDSSKRDEMVQRAGGRMTVPQIFIDGKHIGGSDDLYALDGAGRLDPLLGKRA